LTQEGADFYFSATDGAVDFSLRHNPACFTRPPLAEDSLSIIYLEGRGAESFSS
jgi:hypothetical protein